MESGNIVWVTRPHLMDFLLPEFTVTKSPRSVRFDDNLAILIEPGDDFIRPSPRLRQKHHTVIVVGTDRERRKAVIEESGFSRSSFDTVLETPRDYIEFMADQFGLKIYKYLNKAEDLSEDRLDEFVKMTSINRKWYKGAWQREEAKAYRLLTAFSEGRIEYARELCNLTSLAGGHVTLSCFLTFLEKVQSYDEYKESVSDYYRKQLRKADHQSLKPKKFVNRYLMTSDESPILLRVLSVVA